MSLHRLQSVGRGATENLTGATGGHFLQGQGQSQENCAIFVSNRHVTSSDETLATTTLATRLTSTTTELISQARQLVGALAEVAVEEIGNFVVGDGVACMMAAIFSLREVALRAVFADQTTSYVTIDPPWRSNMMIIVLNDEKLRRLWRGKHGKGRLRGISENSCPLLQS